MFFACDGDAIFLFWKIVVLPACGESSMFNYPCAGDATAEKITEKNRTKFNMLNFLGQSTILSRRLCKGRYTSDFRRVLVMPHFQKIASPFQAKNSSCSRGFKLLVTDVWKTSSESSK